MKYVTSAHTDVGIRKRTNQDSVLIEQADTDYGRILLAAVCDGMGGLAKGELASSTMVRNLSSWFYEELPELLYNGLRAEELQKSWEKLLVRSNEMIHVYGAQQNINLGTTCVAFLVINGDYYIVNVGDSRAYLISDHLYQMTKDQSYIQREIDAGRMTPEQAAVSPQRSVLLQCIGASDIIEPDFYTGKLQPGQCVMMCSDGFAHVVLPTEIYDRLAPTSMVSSAAMKQGLFDLVELDKRRGETDNISVLLLKAI